MMSILFEVNDATKLTPQSTYGTTKAILELLINDYSRKGFLDGRTARLPTVIVRPGKPNDNVIVNISELIVNTGVDFLFGKSINITSRAKEERRAQEIQQILNTVLEINGGGTYLLELALLGSV